MLVEIIFLALVRLLLFNKARYLQIRRSVCLPRIIDLFLFFDRRIDLRLNAYSTYDSRKRIPLYLLMLLLLLILLLN